MQVNLPFFPTVWLETLTTVPVQAVDRALLVDTLPRVEQAKGNAWAAIMLGIGGVSGFFM
jgi:solute carrier family 45, member 1/2/4